LIRGREKVWKEGLTPLLDTHFVNPDKRELKRGGGSYTREASPFFDTLALNYGGTKPVYCAEDANIKAATGSLSLSRITFDVATKARSLSDTYGM